MMVTERIAIVAWGAMADVLYATPIVRHIRLTFPEAYVEWLIRDKFIEVVTTNPDVNGGLAFALGDGYASRQEAEHNMDQRILAFANAEYDKVFDLQYWPRYNNFFENPSEDFISLRARNADIDPDAIKDRKIVLELNEEDENAVEDFLHKKIGHRAKNQPFITVNHISYAASPVWSFENYEKLVGLLEEQGIWSVFTGAPNEPVPDRCIDARGMPYREWAGVIGESNLWLGLDSGAVALAASTDVPIIKLYGADFPLAKTGIKAMGLRQSDVLELCPAPSVGTMVELIVENMK